MPSLPSSTPDDFKDGFDLKTSDLPRKPKLVVGGKSVCQDAHSFPATTLVLTKILSFWFLHWNAVCLRSFRRVYVRDCVVVLPSALVREHV